MVSIIIDGKPADYNGGRIAYNLESNLLNTPKEITANWSHTFTLPRTLTNDQIFAQAWDVANVNARVRSWHDVTYIVDGVAMIDGRLAVVSIDESGYKCNIIWGFEALQEMKREGLKLWQIFADNNEFKWLSTTPITDPREGFTFGFADYESGIGTIDATQSLNPRIFPSVSANYILQLLRARYGVVLDMPTEARETLEGVVLALVTPYIYRGEVYPRASFGLEVDNREDPDTGAKIWFYTWNIWSNGRGIVRSEDVNVCRAATSGKIRNLHIKATARERFFISCGEIQQGVIYSEVVSGTQTIDVTINEAEIASGANILWSFGVDEDTPNHNWLASLRVETYDFDFIPETNEVNAICGYPLAPNLPDLTAWEFIAEVCALVGVIPVSTKLVNNETILTCASWNEIANDVVVLDIQGVETYDTRANGFAQRNYYKFKNDTQGAPVIVDDETIEAERTAWESKLNGLLPNNKINLYSVKIENGERIVERNDESTPTIARLNPLLQGARLTKEGATWAEIIANNYTAYTSALNKPVYLTATAILPPATIKRINLTRGVLIRQLNAIFAVVKITASDNDLYKLELLKIS